MIKKIISQKYLFFLLFFQLYTVICVAQQKEYTLKLVTGQQLKELIPFVVQQRITMFREYPYLYEGDYKEDTTHLEWFAQLPHSAIAVAYYQEKPVGFISGTSFADFDQHFKGSIDLFTKAGLQSSKYYYFPEGIVATEHRGNSLCKKLYALIEKFAISKGYTAGCFVDETHDNHPLKPSNYYSLDRPFKAAGYVKSLIAVKFPWLTIQADGSKVDETHTLTYWLKNFKNNK